MNKQRKRSGGWDQLTPEQREDRIKRMNRARKLNRVKKQQVAEAQERVLNTIEFPLHAVPVAGAMPDKHYNRLEPQVDLDKLAALLVAVAKYL